MKCGIQFNKIVKVSKKLQKKYKEIIESFSLPIINYVEKELTNSLISNGEK